MNTSQIAEDIPLPKNIKFFKPIKPNRRPRLDFEQIVDHSPELGIRTIAVRSRIKSLSQDFLEDSEATIKNFNFITTATIALAVFGILVGIVVSPRVGADGTVTTVVTFAVGTIACIIGAASKAFGLHKRYHAMFKARWAMVSLEVQIDSFLCDMALSTDQGEDLSDEHRAVLRQAMVQWLVQLDAALKTFGDSYGAAISPVELKPKFK